MNPNIANAHVIIVKLDENMIIKCAVITITKNMAIIILVILT